MLFSRVRTVRLPFGIGAALYAVASVGAVGMTGWATGPHLHFEFKVKGHHIDPMTMAKGSESITLSTEDQTRFAVVAREFRSQLDTDRPEAPTGLAYAE